jgi:hypothetical protein
MLILETFEKYSILPAQLNPHLIFNRGSSPRQAKILTTDIHEVFRGLKFEPNAGIGQKGIFFKGLV